MGAADTGGLNISVVRRFYDELWNQWRFELLDEIIAETIRFRSSLGTEVTGRNEFKGLMERVRGVFPDLHHRVDEMLAIGDRVVTRVTYSGTHRGKLGDVEPTDAHVEYVGAAFFRLSGGRMEEGWVVADTAEMWRAIGKL
jgi:predicted ester cyclase